MYKCQLYFQGLNKNLYKVDAFQPKNNQIPKFIVIKRIDLVNVKTEIQLAKADKWFVLTEAKYLTAYSKDKRNLLDLRGI